MGPELQKALEVLERLPVAAVDRQDRARWLELLKEELRPTPDADQAALRAAMGRADVRLINERRGHRSRGPRKPEPEHIGMGGKPCQCTPHGRRKARRGCDRRCPCHNLQHAKCPNAHPCFGDCGRQTTAHESNSPGYCVHCSADRRWRPVFK